MSHSSDLRVQHAAHSTASGPLHASNWLLQPSVVVELVDFHSALLGHLRALDVDDRWLQPLCPLPFEEQTSELLSLWGKLRMMGLPPSVLQSLTDNLQTTLQLASKLREARAMGEEQKGISTRLHAHQAVLEEARDEWLEMENMLPDQSETAALTPAASHLAAGAG